MARQKEVRPESQIKRTWVRRSAESQGCQPDTKESGDEHAVQKKGTTMW